MIRTRLFLIAGLIGAALAGIAEPVHALLILFPTAAAPTKIVDGGAGDTNDAVNNAITFGPMAFPMPPGSVGNATIAGSLSPFIINGQVEGYRLTGPATITAGPLGASFAANTYQIIFSNGFVRNTNSGLVTMTLPTFSGTLSNPAGANLIGGEFFEAFLAVSDNIFASDTPTSVTKWVNGDTSKAAVDMVNNIVVQEPSGLWKKGTGQILGALAFSLGPSEQFTLPASLDWVLCDSASCAQDGHFVPEPATMALVALGLAGVAVTRRRGSNLRARPS